MSNPRRTVAFEVYVQRGQRWQFSARFGSGGKHSALRQAKALEKNPGVRSVKVVREVFDSVSDVTEEHIVYRSPGAPTQQNAATSSMRQQPGNGSRPGRPALRRGVGRVAAIVEGTSGRIGLAVHALSATFVALAAAALTTALLTLGFSGRSLFSAEAVSTAQAAALATVFAAVFLLVGVVAAGPLSPLFEGAAGRSPGSRRVRGRKLGSSRGSVARKSPHPYGSDLSHPEQAHVADLKDYLRKAAKPVRGAYNLHDSFIRFGINLFAAGACEALCHYRGVEGRAKHRIMTATIRALGVTADQAEGFAGSYVESLVADPRYMEMFCSGRQAMLAHLDRKPQSEDMLCRAMDRWATPTAADVARQVTVMVTRIGDFDDGAASAGDRPTREILQNHHDVVGRTVIEFGGMTTKDLQNGSMAVFMCAARAARAAIAIRERLAASPSNTSHRQVAVRIGLNSGEPVVEGNELFGSCVQFAGRIAATAERNQVLVSQSVRDQAIRSGQFDFRVLEANPLKSFSNPRHLYEVALVPPATP